MHSALTEKCLAQSFPESLLGHLFYFRDLQLAAFNELSLLFSCPSQKATHEERQFKIPFFLFVITFQVLQKLLQKTKMPRFYLSRKAPYLYINLISL